MHTQTLVEAVHTAPARCRSSTLVQGVILARMTPYLDVRAGLRSAWELAFPLACAGCAYPGVAWCAGCQSQVTAATALRVVHPRPEPPGFPVTWAAMPYDGPVRHALSTYKDHDRRDLADELGKILAMPLGHALDQIASGLAPGPAWIVPVPSSVQARRRRGDAPLVALARAACATLDRRGVWALRPGALESIRKVADQAGLDHHARAVNLTGAFGAPHELRGAAVVIVDDVATTGATLAEASRALQHAGAGMIFAACIAATVRRWTPCSLHEKDGNRLVTRVKVD